MRYGNGYFYLNSILVLLLAMKIKRIGAIECFDCTNYPSQITCSAAAECEGVGCYFILNNNSTFWVASCSNSISITDRQTSCYKIPDGEEYCVCFNDFCNTPAEIEKAVDLRHTPFTSDPLMPWKDATTQNPHSTLPTRPTILVNTIPTTLLLGKPPDNDDGPDETVTIEANDQPTSSMTTINAPITSTEPRVHYSNHSVLINDSSEVTNQSFNDDHGQAVINQTSIDDEIGAEPNCFPALIAKQNLYFNIYTFTVFIHIIVPILVHFRPFLFVQLMQ